MTFDLFLQESKVDLTPNCRIYTFAEFHQGLMADAKKASLGPIQIDDPKKDRGVGDNQKCRSKLLHEKVHLAVVEVVMRTNNL